MSDPEISMTIEERRVEPKLTVQSIPQGNFFQVIDKLRPSHIGESMIRLNGMDRTRATESVYVYNLSRRTTHTLTVDTVVRRLVPSKIEFYALHD